MASSEDLVDVHRGLMLMKHLASDMKLERHGATVIMDFDLNRLTRGTDDALVASCDSPDATASDMECGGTVLLRQDITPPIPRGGSQGGAAGLTPLTIHTATAQPCNQT